MTIDELLTDLRRTGDKRPLAAHLGEHVIAPMLAKDWVGRLRPQHRDEYASQLYGDLDRVLDRLRDNTVPAGDVLRVARAEFKYTRQHVYAFRDHGNRGRAKASSVRPRRGGANPRAHEREEARTPVYDDPTTAQTIRETSAAYLAGGGDQSNMPSHERWETLKTDIEGLGRYCHTEHELERWMQLLMWTTRFIRATGVQYFLYADLIETLRKRAAGSPGSCATAGHSRLLLAG